MNKLAEAIKVLTAEGREVERCDFPAAPFPGLYLVDGRELTEMQVVTLANRFDPRDE